MAQDIVSMNIPEKVVAQIVEAQVAAKVVEALSGNASEGLIAKIVNAALTLRVDGNGKPSSYSDARPYIEHVAIESIKEAAKEAMKDYVVSNQAKIKKEVEKQLKNSTSKLVSAFMNTLVKEAESQYSYAFKVNVDVDKKKA